MPHLKNGRALARADDDDDGKESRASSLEPLSAAAPDHCVRRAASGNPAIYHRYASISRFADFDEPCVEPVVYTMSDELIPPLPCPGFSYVGNSFGTSALSLSNADWLPQEFPTTACDRVSPKTGRFLPAFIARNFSARNTAMARILVALKERRSRSHSRSRLLVPGPGSRASACATRDPTKAAPPTALLHLLSPAFGMVDFAEDIGSAVLSNGGDPAALDFVYFSRRHLGQVNCLLRSLFWPNIEVSEFLETPDHSIVALRGALVVGCGLCSPDGYVSFISVLPGWRGDKVASVLLHLAIRNIKRDITLHVGVDNPAMIMYQKFGFKAEEFIVGFYDKYLPKDSKESRNAFFMRLRRSF